MLYTVENTLSIGRNVNVYLDGVEVEDCVEAEDTEGWVKVLSFDADGSMKAIGDSVATEKKFGFVKVVDA